MFENYEYKLQSR